MIAALVLGLQGAATAAPRPPLPPPSIHATALANPIAALGVDFAVPQSPAFTFLGVLPLAVSRPGAPRELAVALLDVIDSAGGVRRGVAVDAAPYLLGWGGSLTLQRYRESAWRRLLANTQLSLATARSSGDSGATDLAVGLRAVLVDRGDLRRDATLLALIGGLQLAALPDCPASAADAACRGRWRAFAAAGLDSLNARLDSLRAAYGASHWNALKLELGAGLGWTAARSQTDSVRWLGAGVWAGGAAPLGRRGQIAATAAWRHRRAPVPSEGWTLAGRLLVGGATLTAFAEVLGVFQSGAVPGDPDVGRVAWGLEWRLAADLWIETGVGSTFGTASAPEHLFTLATLKWALADRPKFSLPAR